LAYCLKHRKVLGANGQDLARAYTWEAACEKVSQVYRLAMEEEPATVSVVIPVYNKTVEQVNRAIQSVLAQTYRANEIIVVDDGSQNSGEMVDLIEAEYGAFVDYIYQENQGVANARNNGIAVSGSKYICCLDADDWIEPSFLELCVQALEEDRSLGIAYAGLRWHNHADHTSSISDWPPAWNYDNQLKKQNQIPTCAVFRRAMWQRLGGYRQRYAPDGAGAEDAEFWLRAGAYGWAAKKVTDEPLFNYSLGGSVSGNKEYREPDWLAWYPFVKDGLHPFASYATPKRQSHPVRQYDQPVVSVVIPVGPGHEKDVINALDSLEAQTFRKWEAVVALDAPIEVSELKRFVTAYPYVKIVEAFDKSAVSKFGGYAPKGAGFARNRGAEIARAPFILFLDADDTLHPLALEKMLEAYSRTGQGIYTDYVGQAFISEELAAELDQKKRLLSYNPKDGESIISYQAADFDCPRALRQPEEGQMYIWNLITTLIPRAWHNEIGGFDEQMETWEDWDYWLRLARAGKCFYRLDEQLVRYRFYTGKRRAEATPDTEAGRQKAQAMIKYLQV
ncbi:MAG TPA: glycosyltransferase family 2 protein, partial [Anaerolineae bacterium]|nr:glycosyltransferase family 2 protein [Anaerolineae bacterium]